MIPLNYKKSKPPRCSGFSLLGAQGDCDCCVFRTYRVQSEELAKSIAVSVRKAIELAIFHPDFDVVVVRVMPDVIPGTFKQAMFAKVLFTMNVDKVPVAEVDKRKLVYIFRHDSLLTENHR